MKKFLPFLGVILAGHTATAQTQIRNADISVEITSPADNVTIPAGDSLYLSFDYTNNGPDMLPAGDTLFFFSGGIVLYSYLNADLPVGGGISMNDMVYYHNPTNEPITGSFCMLHIPQSAVTYPNGGGMAQTTYQDNNPLNDTACIRATLETTPSSLKAVKAPKNQFEIFPNPASEKLFVNLLQNGSEVTISIINNLGQVVSTKQVNAAQEKAELDVAQLPAGIYFIRQVAGAANASARFTIQR